MFLFFDFQQVNAWHSLHLKTERYNIIMTLPNSATNSGPGASTAHARVTNNSLRVYPFNNNY